MLSSKRQILYDEQSMSACRIYFDQGTDVIQRVVQPASVFRRKGVDLYAASSDIENIAEFVEAENFEALQRLFSKFCDKEGLITKKAVMMIPAIADLMVRVCENI